ncbi:MAG: hypothetical protein M3522_01485 [Actinomycetota bacterium]|jgi:hypothetical protein|nr:hypothetical protein [Actinomycetota bacterium]
MKQFHSLPDPKEEGFSWPAFDAALERVHNVERRRHEAERTVEELQERISGENQQDIQRLAAAIAAGAQDPAPPELEDLASELREQRRLGKALEEAEPRAEGELSRVVAEHREEWEAEVEGALEKAIAAERRALEKAMQPVQKARARRQYLESLAGWIRTTPPVFSPPSDATVPVAFSQLSQDADRAERQAQERHEAERQAQEENRRREAKEREAAEKGAA